MLETTINIQELDTETASEAEWRAITAFRSVILAEIYPDDPPPSLEQTIANLRDAPPFLGKALWAVWGGSGPEIVAGGLLNWLHTEENQHVAQFTIEVLPAWRRQGLGSRILAEIVKTTQAQGRRLLILTTYGNVPAGEAFATRIGATIALASHTNQLDLAALDRELIGAWLAQGAARAAAFELGLWEGPYPEDQLDAVVELTRATNMAPRGDLDIEDFQWTAEQIRQQEAARAAQGTERWTYYLRERATGALAGYTELFWRPNEPGLLRQGFTAVWPQYRGRGLGRWLKAAMLDKVLRERPQVRYVRTENADSNAAMLKINQELGFRPYQSESAWQVEVARVAEYLAERADQ